VTRTFTRERVTGIEPASPAWKIGQTDFSGRRRSVFAGHSVAHTASDDLGFPRPRDGRAMEMDKWGRCTSPHGYKEPCALGAEPIGSYGIAA
jgi:hypothetical protein